ncbi:MAG TPA: DNA polymerase III subunit alpha, partial [Saprospiraceae bacterium]|nr:DNA polymerase III subunit alpha [Saprospiraceae bacterium]
YSLKYGLMSPEKLVQLAMNQDIKTLVLTDINNTSATYQFISACLKNGMKPIVGVEFRSRDFEFLYLGIAKNEEGWAELCSHLTAHSLEDKPLPKVAPHFKNCFVVYRHLPKGITQLYDHEYVGIRPEEVNHLYSSYMRNHLHKLVVFSPVTFADHDGYRAHKLLRCIDLNIVISKLEAKHHAKATEVFVNEVKLKSSFEQYPDIIANTLSILDQCSMVMESTPLHNRQTFTGNKSDDMKLLTKLAVKGCEQRYGMNRKAMDRTLKELKVIEQMGFCAYFLITWDIVRYAHSVGYFHVGRGSGANSIVAYALKITDVDPLELDLYFERFINPYRSSPPDFDIDFSWNNRDDVTDYIFKRYGHEFTALLATYNTFKGKSIIRELGKVLGLPKADIDLIVDQPLASDKHHPFAKHIFKYGKMIEGLPNYLSIHAGGILISERPLYYHTALQLMPKGFPIVHFDMYGAEDLQFHKYDVLSQRGLGHIKDAVDLVKVNQGKAIDIHDVTKIKEDINVKAQLRSGQCIGCFYIESPAMRGLLSKLKCDNYIHLVAASSIIRPGVAKSGMMREYIQRFHKPDSFSYLHPVFEEHLGETFGVMVYQEDVMKIVHHFADLDLDESDVLRRIMTGKKKNSDTFRNLHEKFFTNCRAKGYPDDLSQEVWRQVESFSGYSFCKAHSASFAIESFQSLYLKTYFPLEFMTAVINNFGGFYHTEYYVHEARMCGANIQPPCVNNSMYLTHIYDKTIYLGFVHMANLEQKVAHLIVEERRVNGDYYDLQDFINRVKVSREQLEILIRIGAFRFTGLNKYQLMWEKNAVFNPTAVRVQSIPIFDLEPDDYELPILDELPHEQAFDEIEILGFPLCSPFDLLDTSSVPPRLLAESKQTNVVAAQLKELIGKAVSMVGYYVTQKPVTASNGKLMAFGTWLDRQGHYFDTTHFPLALAKYPFRGRGLYLIVGRVVDDFGFPSVEVDQIDKLPFVKDGRY